MIAYLFFGVVNYIFWECLYLKPQIGSTAVVLKCAFESAFEIALNYNICVQQNSRFMPCAFTSLGLKENKVKTRVRKYKLIILCICIHKYDPREAIWLYHLHKTCTHINIFIIEIKLDEQPIF